MRRLSSARPSRGETRNAPTRSSVAYDTMRGALFFLLVSRFAIFHGCSRGSDATDRAVPRHRESRRAIHARPNHVVNDEAPDAEVEPPISSGTAALRAGEYRLILRAERGSSQGASSEGTLTLVTASATDKSEITGQIANDVYGPPLFYGWTKLEFGRIAAPVCRNPDPASRDPVRPGVVVLARTHLDQQVVLIGTVSSLRDGSLYTDGCGIALRVEGSDANCYRGGWDRWGIVANGSGTFEACSFPDASSP